LRDREYRRRQAAGTMTVMVEVDHAIVDFLIETRWLLEPEAGDRRTIGSAIGGLLREARRR